MWSRIGLLIVGLILVSQVGAWWAEPPIALSSARADTGAVVESRCPTFSWGDVLGAKSYEPFVYHVAEHREDTEPTLWHSFPGSIES